MLHAPAHSYQQQSRLAITLAWVAGYTNIVALLACGTTTSHVSGTASALGSDLAGAQWDQSLFAGFVLGAFLAGAALSGLAMHAARRAGWRSIYVLPVALETLLLGVFALGLEFVDTPRAGWARWWLPGIAAAAMGLQNATITRISAGVVRTTHVTGVLTDMGLELVNTLAPHREIAPAGESRGAAGRRFLLLTTIFFSFATGAALGTLAQGAFPRLVMFPPALFLAWIIYQDLVRPIAGVELSDLLRHADLSLPEEIEVFQLTAPRRRGRRQHLPALSGWVDTLDPRRRLVILDLGLGAVLDAEGAAEVLAAQRRMLGRGGRLIVAGLGAEQIAALRHADTTHELEPASLCPDLELAIARALALTEERGASG